MINKIDNITNGLAILRKYDVDGMNAMLDEIEVYLNNSVTTEDYNQLKEYNWYFGSTHNGCVWYYNLIVED